VRVNLAQRCWLHCRQAGLKVKFLAGWSIE
jgi:hypothetical protein